MQAEIYRNKLTLGIAEPQVETLENTVRKVYNINTGTAAIYI